MCGEGEAFAAGLILLGSRCPGAEWWEYCYSSPAWFSLWSSQSKKQAGSFSCCSRPSGNRKTGVALAFPRPESPWSCEDAKNRVEGVGCSLNICMASSPGIIFSGGNFLLLETNIFTQPYFWLFAENVYCCPSFTSCIPQGFLLNISSEIIFLF